MHVSYRFSGTSAEDFHREGLERLIPMALTRFAGQVMRVQVSVEDVNGPRGGIDKRCRCVIQVKHQASVVVEERGEALGPTMKRLADRVVFTLSKRRGRQKPDKQRKQREKTKKSGLFGSVGRPTFG